MVSKGSRTLFVSWSQENACIFDKVHQLHKENQILMITAQTSSGQVSKKKKNSLPLFSIFFFFFSFLFRFKLAYA